MRKFFSVAALSVAAFTLSASSSEAGDFSSYGEVTAKRDGDTVSIVIEGNGEWHVNTAYNMKVMVGEAVLRKKDAKFEDEQKGGKARRALFSATDKETKEGGVKAVFCNATTCTSPLKTTFNIITADEKTIIGG